MNNDMKKKKKCKCCPNGSHITQPGTKRHDEAPNAGEGHKFVLDAYGREIRVPLTADDIRQAEIRKIFNGGDA